MYWLEIETVPHVPSPDEPLGELPVLLTELDLSRTAMGRK